MARRAGVCTLGLLAAKPVMEGKGLFKRFAGIDVFRDCIEVSASMGQMSYTRAPSQLPVQTATLTQRNRLTSVDVYNNGTISSATILIILISGLMAGPAVSL